jgi:putative phosphoribosyl transferase
MFNDRYDAAHQLLALLQEYKNKKDLVILAIPRGGLELGYVFAKELHAPLDIVFSKKIGAPGQPELAIGAMTLDTQMINPIYAREYPEYIQQETLRIHNLLRKRYKDYRGDSKPINLTNKIVIVTDDGIATGQTFLLALDHVKKQHPKKIIAAVPVIAADAFHEIQQNADVVITLIKPEFFWGIGQFYRNFTQVDDDEAIRLLKEANT